MPLAWAPGTDGVLKGAPIFAPLQDKDDHEDQVAELERYMETWRGKLRGKMVLLTEPPHITPETEASLKRFDSSD